MSSDSNAVNWVGKSTNLTFQFMIESSSVRMPDHPTSSSDLPSLSVIVLCRNEIEHIESCLTSLLNAAYPPERLEVVVVDGMSTDGTRDIVGRIRSQDHRLRLVDNPRLITPAAMNIGVHSSAGSLIAIVSAHVSFDRDYLAECVKHLLASGADQAGGVVKYVPRRPTAFGRAIATSLTHPVGAGANARYKTGASERIWVDTAFCSVSRRELFSDIGNFDERLVRSQDMDFSNRVRRSGGRILLVPNAVVTYYARSGLGESTRYNFWNGFWATFPLTWGIKLFRWRHLMPLVLVLVVLISVMVSLVSSAALTILAVLSGTYLGTLLVGSVTSALRSRDFLLVLTLPIAIGALHFSYGLGSLWGLIRLLDRHPKRGL